MEYVVAGVVALVAAAVGVVLWRRHNAPSAAMFAAIDQTVRELQRKALRNVLPEQKEGEVAGFDEKKMRDQTASLHDVIRFVYTVEHQQDGFLHVVSSQLKRARSKKYQIQCMLVVMLVFSRELAESGVEQEDVKFQIDESELGTQYVCMLLTPDQHDQLVGTVLNQP